MKECLVYFEEYGSLRISLLFYLGRSVPVEEHSDIARAECATHFARAEIGVVCDGGGCSGGWAGGCGGEEQGSRVLWRIVR